MTFLALLLGQRLVILLCLANTGRVELGFAYRRQCPGVGRQASAVRRRQGGALIQDCH